MSCPFAGPGPQSGYERGPGRRGSGTRTPTSRGAPQRPLTPRREGLPLGLLQRRRPPARVSVPPRALRSPGGKTGGASTRPRLRLRGPPRPRTPLRPRLRTPHARGPGREAAGVGTDPVRDDVLGPPPLRDDAPGLGRVPHEGARPPVRARRPVDGPRGPRPEGGAPPAVTDRTPARRDVALPAPEPPPPAVQDGPGHGRHPLPSPPPPAWGRDPEEPRATRADSTLPSATDEVPRSPYLGLCIVGTRVVSPAFTSTGAKVRVSRWGCPASRRVRPQEIPSLPSAPDRHQKYDGTRFGGDDSPSKSWSLHGPPDPIVSPPDSLRLSP